MNVDRREAWGFSLFSDDLRIEVGGKVSLMGLYQRDFILQGPTPFIYPRLCILIMYYEAAGAIASDINIRVHLPGDTDEPSISNVVHRSQFPPASQLPIDLDPDQEPVAHLRMPITISPFAVEREGHVKVRAHYDDGRVLNLGALRVLIQIPSEPNSGARTPTL